MKIMAVSRRLPGTTFEMLQAYQHSEVSLVWDYQRRGIIREIYFDSEKPAVVVILEAETLGAAKVAMAEMPMAKAKLLDFDFYTLGPYVQIETLFAK